MKVNYKKFLQFITSCILGLLGFTSCGDSYGPDEYGTPHINYNVIGNVTDESGNPIVGIRVIKNDNEDRPDTIYTDAKGQFKTHSGMMIGSSLKDSQDTISVKLKYNDVDGTANGSFKEDSTLYKEMSSKQTAKGSGAWDNGTYQLSITKKLKKVDGK